VGGLSRWLFRLFLSTWGIGVLAALDSSILFSLPFALDAALVLLVAQHRDLFWLYPLLVVPPSVAGAALTYWIGLKLGEEGLKHVVPPKRLDRVRDRVHRSGAFALAALALVPPPFPFTPVVLVSGALDVDRKKFFLTLAAARLLRFGGEAVVAFFYGRLFIVWMKSDAVRLVAGTAFLLLLVGAAVSGYQLYRSAARRRGARPVKAEG
jgi:membrane protein YqaA with SNARE-associated domain